MRVTVEGTDLPGRRCGPAPEGGWYENVHVGLCLSKGSGLVAVPGRPWGVTGVVPGDAGDATWELEVVVKDRDGELDFGGPAVRGQRGDRHVGLAWGVMPSDGRFELFRAAKLRLDAIDPDILREADQPGKRLVARLGLTDAQGQPRCASVRPPAITWSAEQTAP